MIGRLDGRNVRHGLAIGRSGDELNGGSDPEIPVRIKEVAYIRIPPNRRATCTSSNSPRNHHRLTRRFRSNEDT